MTLRKIYDNVSNELSIDSSGSKFKFEFCKKAFTQGFDARTCFNFFKDQKLKGYSLKTLEKEFEKIQGFKNNTKKAKTSKGGAHLVAIEKAFEERYEYYYDSIKDENYVKRKGSKEPFERLQSRLLNSIWRELNLEMETSVPINTLELDFNSGFFPTSSGLHRFLDSLPLYDGKDYIDMISECVKTTACKSFKDRFKKWFVGMVASILNVKDTNGLVLVLCGKQGIGKTRFFNKLIPDEISEFYMSDLPKMREKDTKIAMAEHLLIVIDEIDALTSGENTAFKELITSPKVNVRKPYDKKQRDYKRYATFAGTSNHERILTDTTGSRRFLCFSVDSIDLGKDFPIMEAFSQAVNMVKNGYQFWLDKKELAEQERFNQKFKFVEPEEELLLEFTRTAVKSDDEQEIYYFQTTTLLPILYRLADVNRTISNIAVKKLGAALTKNGYKRVSKNGRKVWEIVLIQSHKEPLAPMK